MRAHPVWSLHNKSAILRNTRDCSLLEKGNLYQKDEFYSK